MTIPVDFKFGAIENESDPIVKQYLYSNVWNRQSTSHYERLIIAPESNQIDLIIELTKMLPEPFGLLYVLVVPRGGNKEGRYQNKTPANRRGLESFLTEFKDFFEEDARHNMWIVSIPTDSILVYDRHNVIYAYGEIETYMEILTERGFSQGDLTIPVPHVHNYNAKFDDDESRILSNFPWKHFPLIENDY